MRVAELAVKVILKKNLFIRKDERNLTYRYDQELGWFPVENSKKRYDGSRSIAVEHNSRGFRDAEPGVDTELRMVFLGDSFVWGYDAEKEERFTEKLRAKLPDWSLYNLGVSGYGTDQEYLLLKRNFDFYRPNIVFLIFCTDTDWDDNSSNVRYGRYYKPYFTVDGGHLMLGGVPVPKSENYFFGEHPLLSQSCWFVLFTKAYFRLTSPPALKLKNPTEAIFESLNQYIKAKGAEFLVGVTDKSPELERFLQRKDIPYVDLSNSYKYRTHGGHWTPEGNDYVSRKIHEFLISGKYLQQFAMPAPPSHTNEAQNVTPPHMQP